MSPEKIDWTDDTLLPLGEAARIAFPGGSVTARTLKYRARQGRLTVYRPGKAYLTSLVEIAKMIQACAVPLAKPAVRSVVPNSLGLTESDLARAALNMALADLRAKTMPRRSKKAGP